MYGVNATDGTGNKFDFDWCFYLGTLIYPVEFFVNKTTLALLIRQVRALL